MDEDLQNRLADRLSGLRKKIAGLLWGMVVGVPAAILYLVVKQAKGEEPFLTLPDILVGIAIMLACTGVLWWYRSRLLQQFPPS